MLELSRREARRLMLGAQLLAGPKPKRVNKQKLLEMVRHLGVLQIDSISVVARSHHIVSWSRIGNHDPEWLYELAGDDRQLFEYWAHAAAFVPIELFPYFRRMMLEHRDPEGRYKAYAKWRAEHAEVVDQVLSFIKEHGAVSTSSFAPPDGAEKPKLWAWYGNKPTNLALDILYSDGTLMIDRRVKFQRRYDLLERVMPDWDDRDMPSVHDENIALATVALNAMGVTTARWLADYFRKNYRGGARHAALQHLTESGAATPVSIQGVNEPAWASTAWLERRIPLSRTTLLSPFDGLVWDRERVLELFDFPLLLEAYTPAAKRVYGYFSLPILHRDQLVGRLDPKADRKTRHLTVNALHLEPWYVGKDDERFYAQLAASLREFAEFNGCDEISVVRSDPEPAAARLRSALNDNSPAG